MAGLSIGAWTLRQRRPFNPAGGVWRWARALALSALAGSGAVQAAGLSDGDHEFNKPAGLYATPPGFTPSPPAVRSGGGYMDPNHFASSPPSHSHTGTDDDEDPPPPYAYLMGFKRRDLAAPTRLVQPDQMPDTWLRLYPRNLLFVLNRGSGTDRWPGVKGFILRTRGTANYKQWDTLPGSVFPMLQVEYQGRIVNGFDGSIAGFHPPADGSIDLFIGDEGSIASRHIPLQLEIITLEGRITIDVRPWCSPQDNLCS